MTIKETIRTGLSRISQHLWLVLVPASICFFGGATWAVLSADRYESTEVLAIRMARPSDGMIRSAVVTSARDMIKSVQERLLSRENLEEIARELEPFPSQKDDIDRVVRRLRRLIRVRVNRSSNTVIVSFATSEGADPADMAHRVVAAAVEKYRTEQSKLVTGEGFSLQNFLETNASRYRTALEQKEVTLSTFRHDYAGKLPEDEAYNRGTIVNAQQRIRESEERKDRNRISRESVNIELLRLQGTLKRANEDFEGDEEVQRMRNYLLGLKQTLIDARGIHTDESDAIARLRGQIERTQKSIDELIQEKKTTGTKQNSMIELYQSMIKTLQSNLELFDKRDRISDEAAVEAAQQVEAARANILEGKKIAAEYKNLKIEVEDAKEWRVMLFKKFQEAKFQMEFQEHQDALPLRSISPARKSSIPVGPKRLELSLAGLAFGLAAGVGLAFLKERFDGSLKNGNDLRMLLPGAIVVTLPEIQSTGVRISVWLRNMLMGGAVALLFTVALLALGIRMEWWGDISMIQPVLDRLPSL